MSNNAIHHTWNSGLTNGVFHAKHADKMGMAIYLFAWIVSRQTGLAPDGRGVVLHGQAITYDLIARDTGHPRRTLERWMEILADHKYVATERLHRGIRIYVLKPKKRVGKQGHLFTGNPQPHTPKVAHHDTPKVAYEHTKSGVSQSPRPPHKPLRNHGVAAVPHTPYTSLYASKSLIQTDSGSSLPANQEPKPKPPRAQIFDIARAHAIPSDHLPKSEAWLERRRIELRRQAEALMDRPLRSVSK